MVTATNADNETAQQSFTASAVTDTNVDPPFLGSVSANQNIAVGQTLNFSIASTDLSGQGVDYEIASMDDSPNASVDVDHATGLVTIIPDAGFAGTLHLIVGVRAASAANTFSNFDVQEFTVTVVAPTLDPVADQTAAVGTPITFTLNSTDPLGNGVVYSVVDANSLGAPDNISVDIDQANGQVTLTPAAGATGTVTLLARVRELDSPDDPANYTSQAFTFSVLAPTLDPVGSQTSAVGVPVNIAMIANDSLGNDLFYAVVDASTLAAPDHVNISVNQNAGEVIITPESGFAGTLNLLAAVRDVTSPDDVANYATQVFAFTVVAPTLDPVDNQTTIVDLPVTFTLHSSDALGNDVTYSVVDANTLIAPAHSTVGIDQVTGQVTITPEAGFSGTLNLLARVIDVTSPDDPANYTTQAFTLTVVTLAPVSDQTTGVGAPTTFTLFASPLGGDVFYTIVDPSTFASPGHVTVTIEQATGQVTLKPDAGFSGTLNLLAGVRGANSDDAEANYTTQAFTLDVIAPSIDTVANQTTAVGVADDFTLTSTDPTGGGVFYAIVDPDTFGAPPYVVVTIDQASGHVTLKPEAGFAGTINLAAAVRELGSDDVPANYVTQSFTLTVLAPSLLTVGNQTTTLGVSDTLSLSGIDFTGGDLIYTVVDPTTFNAPAHVTVTIDQATGQITLQPDAGFAGDINLLAGIRAADSDDVQANYTTQAFTFSVVAPTLNTINNLVTTVDTPASFTLSSTDLGGSGVAYSIVDPTTMLAPAHVTIGIDQAIGLVNVTPDAGFAGTINLLARVRAVDSADVLENYVTQGFTLTVDQVAVNPINDVEVPGGKSVLVPLTGVDAAGNPITYTTSSSDPNVTVSLVSPTSKSLVLNVTGTDKDGNAFSGQLILHLFEDLAPETTARIEQLVTQGYYDGLSIFRVLDGFVTQTGNNGAGDTGQLLTDEFDTSLTFTSPGLLAMANRGRDTADAEFFITATDAAGSTTPISLADMPQFLDFRYTIFGQLVGGFDTFEKIMSTNVTTSSQIPGETSSPTLPITVTSAQIITDTQNAVLKVTAPASFNGSQRHHHSDRHEYRGPNVTANV